MSEKQKTIHKEVAIEGIGLHTGSKVRVCFKPGAINAGINFVRVDLPGAPSIKADASNVLTDEKSLPRCTSIGNGEAVIHTAEHLMSTLAGLGIDNLTIEVNGKEIPGLDGSGIDFLKTLKEAGIQEQNAAKEYFEIKEPVWVERNGSSIFAIPASDFRISYVLDYNRPELLPQCFNAQMQPDIFEREIAPCRTFCLESEAEELKRNGLGKGANYQNTLVITKDGVKDNKVRFPNEFARHKTLDLIGDLYLLGMPLKGHVFAVKSGHTLNVALLKKIAEQKKKYQTRPVPVNQDFTNTQELDITAIMKILPHRYPFLLVDRVVALEPGKKAVGIKNVTINDGFFQGHFPSRPVMPGVLMVEAMAQVGGIAVLTDSKNSGQLAFFLSADKVKFRKVVLPGDQLVMEVEVIKIRGRTAQVSAQSKVNGEVVAEAEMMFSFVESNYLAQS